MTDQTIETPIELLRENEMSPRAQFLWIYLSAHPEQSRHTQEHLCGAIGIGNNGQQFNKYVAQLEANGWLRVNRSVKPHRYELLRKNTEENTLW
ncbi:hypothetical protein [Streptomyces zaomyceticus]|uniref:hypothetical protein n=1 Tax=Streptomyces zaomyceticus TaxID=68286 RepID=UPI0037B20C87